MSEVFNSRFFAANRRKLCELFTGTAPIVITANGLLQRGGDSTFPFRQDANFWYLTGIDEPDVILVIDKGKEYLIVPAREQARQAFDGTLDFEVLASRSGISRVVDDSEGWRLLQSRLKRSKHVATLAPPPAYIEQHGLYTNPARARLIDTIKTINANIELLDLSQHLTQQRMIKHANELAAIREAVLITSSTIKALTRSSNLSKYHFEYEIEADISRSFRRAGAAGHAFEPIVASGERACTLHNVANQGKLGRSDLLVLDIGAEFDHYAADITRTVALGTVNRRKQAVYDAVIDVQDYAKSLLKPGVLIHEYEKEVGHYMGEKLRALGLIKTIDQTEISRWYPHATSHFMGLNVHDAGDYNRPLEAGMVLTVEPGIYIPEEAIGIRIEDDVLITSDGIEVLSKNLPRRLR